METDNLFVNIKLNIRYFWLNIKLWKLALLWVFYVYITLSYLSIHTDNQNFIGLSMIQIETRLHDDLMLNSKNSPEKKSKIQISSIRVDIRNLH